MPSIPRISAGLVRLAGLGIAALGAAMLSPRAAAAQTLTIGSPNTATADPTVPRPRTTPCIVDLFDGVAFADFSSKTFQYAPPSGCAGPWAKVVLEADWSITAGVQFDRTANVWIGGTNVYFGTTAEPSSAVSRSWHVERDLTDYSALFRSPQPGRTDLGNLVNATFTSVLHGSARLVIYPALGDDDDRPGAPRAADLVIPLAADATGGTVALTAAGSPLSRTVTLPRNVERAVVDVVAQSQAGDEFWYACVPDDVAGLLQSCGGTAFRETELSLDGQPAGVAPVYPWIYTGGIDPFLWRPIPGVQTLNFEPYRVELTPFAGLLDDGAPHTVSLGVFNANDHFSTTATLLVWLDHGAARVTGGLEHNTLAAAPAPEVIEALTTAPDGSLSGTVSVTSNRAYSIAGWVQTSHGRVETEVVQDVAFSNAQSFQISGTEFVQDIVQGTTISTETRTRKLGRLSVAHRQESWPLSVGLSFVVAGDGTSAQTTTIQQALQRTELSLPGEELASFERVDNAVATADTLHFDPSGAFTGNTAQASSQRYFSIDGSGACFSRRLTSGAGLLTSVKDGAGCPPHDDD